MLSEIRQEKLENGLQVNLKEFHSARSSAIGSGTGWARATKWPAKPAFRIGWSTMQFKGTPKFAPGVLDRAISRDGGFWNAFTFLDWTTFLRQCRLIKSLWRWNWNPTAWSTVHFHRKRWNRNEQWSSPNGKATENEPLFRLDEAMQSAALPATLIVMRSSAAWKICTPSAQ